jgi:3',5'-cyclic-AMP phosphodiesterase
MKLAHLSDLHLGQSAERGRATEALVQTLLDSGVENIVVTGDLTHRGRTGEYAEFLELFAPLRWQRNVWYVPGNHDRTGDDVGAAWMNGQRVRTQTLPGLSVVEVDSTGPHNRSYYQSHGSLCEAVLAQLDEALGALPAEGLVAVALHHHVLPLPVESLGEHFAEWFNWPQAFELELGAKLVKLLEGRCDLLLHGHRHVPAEVHIPSSSRPLRVCSAGSSTELRRFRVFDTRHRSQPGIWMEEKRKPSSYFFSPYLSGLPRTIAAARTLGTYSRVSSGKSFRR